MILGVWFESTETVQTIYDAIESLNETGLTEYHCPFCANRDSVDPPDAPNPLGDNEGDTVPA